ncbi:hypothetical protein EJ06DRAFT_158545 [Trichodelitschia bisporula]|uniref:[histone H3]-trimethyl-L-lysine(9) demethylase n=1 Tax=Trichodelitschia bisporula TaxID=703511 RepID=A0A6G1HMA8_9PEZI|nr:hypothetical protein EJ06DRAFT_158545 [Trichodelitschia bisporula]
MASSALSPAAMDTDPPLSPKGAAADAGSDGVTARDEQVANSNRVLTPPTSEDHRHDDSSSELSELEPIGNLADLELDDNEDIGEIEPDHYFGDGKIPIFKPTMAQFRSFKRFVDKINKYGMKSGIVKIIPPKEWTDSLPQLDQAVKTIKVKNPITQEFGGTYGTYTQANIEKQRSYNLPQWKALCEESNHQPPAKRGERRRPARQTNQSTVYVPPPKPAPTKQDTSDAPRKRGRPRKHPLPHEEQAPTPPSEDEDPDFVEKGVKQTKDVKDKTKKRGRQPKSKSVSSRRMNNLRETNEVDENAFEGFDYRLENVNEYTPERCRELEEIYWKTLNYGQPMYGADMPGSLFDERTTSWNVAHLENLLDVLGTKVPGVNTTYLYLGMWKATFSWHLEDMDLYSINYIHFGAPKQWYSISQEDARRFEHAMRTLWPNDAKHCDQFLRHKTYLISPEKLKAQFNITVNRLVHYEGEFVITYPYGYHSGFNLGYNCAESVNFATEEWLNYGRIAKKCNCEEDSVWVDVEEIERKLRGEPTPEWVEVTDDESEEEVVEEPTSNKPKSRKRPREETKTKGPRKTKRLKIRIRSAAKEPCVLCPNDVSWDVLLPTDNGKQAHRICAMHIPETWIAVENGREKVCGVSDINRERLNLKCVYCHSKRGACFQCCATKCTRSFHATCAPAAGVQIDAGPTPIWVEGGKEYYIEGYDQRCRFHRPRRPKQTDSKSLESNNLAIQFARTVRVGQVVQAQLLSGDPFAGVVVENRHGETMLTIDVIPDGDRVEVEWKYLLVLDPADSQRPKPSADAPPLPEELSNNKGYSNRQEGVPEMGESFFEGSSLVWTEFSTAKFKNPIPLKVDLSKPWQCFYYIPKGSTETRAQYTENPKNPRHTTRSVFLETVKPPPPPPRPKPIQTQQPRMVYAPPRVAPSYQLANLQPRPLQPVQIAPQANMQQNSYRPRVVNQNFQPSGYQLQQPPRPPPIQTSMPRQRDQAFASHSFVPSYTPPSPSPGRLDNSPPYRNYYQQAERRYASLAALPAPPLLSPEISRQVQPPAPVAPVPSPVAQILGTGGSPQVPQWPQFTPPSQRHNGHSRSVSNVDYLNHLQGYPYLINTYLRRPKTYSSPYLPGHGFSAEYQAKLGHESTESNTQPETPQIAPAPPRQALSYGQPRRTIANGHQNPQQLQFQTPHQFQQDMFQQSPQLDEVTGQTKFDSLIRQLNAAANGGQNGTGYPSNGYARPDQQQSSHSSSFSYGHNKRASQPRLPTREEFIGVQGRVPQFHSGRGTPQHVDPAMLDRNNVKAQDVKVPVSRENQGYGGFKQQLAPRPQGYAHGQQGQQSQFGGQGLVQHGSPQVHMMQQQVGSQGPTVQQYGARGPTGAAMISRGQWSQTPTKHQPYTIQPQIPNGQHATNGLSHPYAPPIRPTSKASTPTPSHVNLFSMSQPVQPLDPLIDPQLQMPTQRAMDLQPQTLALQSVEPQLLSSAPEARTPSQPAYSPLSEHGTSRA